jgi:hypothetical protein
MPLAEDELSIFDKYRPDSNLSESLDFASRVNADEFAESVDLPVSHGVYTANKPEILRLRKLNEIDPVVLKESYPKTSEWLSDTKNAAVANDDLDILKGLEATLREPERGFWNNAARGGLNTVNQLTGNLLEFAGNSADNFEDFMVNTIGMPNPGIVFGDDGVSWSWNIPPEKTDAGYIGRAISEGDGYDYMPRFTWENLKGDVTPTNLAGYVVEQGVQSLPHMIATLYTLPAYIASRTEDIAESRVSNDDRDKVTTKDLVTSIVPATAVAIVERLGAKATFATAKTVGLKGVAKATGVAATVEGATEFIQEGIEYLGETAFTKKDVSFAEMVDRQFAGLVAGAGMGGTIRGATSTLEAVANRTESRVMTAVQSMSEQETIDQIITYAQSSTTNGRASAQFADFISKIGEDMEILIPQEIAAQLENAPEYIASQLNDLDTSVSIPMDKFASEVAPVQEWIDLIRPHIKMSENNLTQSELEAGDRTELKALLKKAQADQDVLTEADRVFEDVKDQLVATGMQAETTARYSAQLYPAAAAVYVEKARKAGHDIGVSDVYEMMGFRVEAGPPVTEPEPMQILDQADIPADLEIAMDVQTIETGKTALETFNAKELVTGIDQDIDTYQRLKDCLG